MALDATGLEFREAALELRAADVALMPVARKRIAAIGAPAVARVKQSALSTLPKGGQPIPLNEWVASASIKTITMYGARTAGVAIRARKTGHDLAAIDAGIVRHPTYGNRKAWATTNVQPGFFTRPLEAMEPIATALFLAAMTETAAIAGFH